MAERRLRVLFLAPQPFFEVRGTPLAVQHLTRALAGLGHEIDLLSLPQGEDAPFPGVRHLRSPRLPVGRVKAGPSLAKMLLDVPFVAEAVLRMAFGRYDVVHAVEESAHLVAAFARLLGVPLVVDVDSSIPDQLRYSGFATRGPLVWLAEGLETHALRHAAAAVTVCTSLTEGVKRRAPGLAVFQVEDPPLVDRRAPPAADAVASLRRELGLGDGPVVLYSGNFEPYQGVELLLDSAPLVPGARFLFMGGRPQEIEALRARAAAIGASARVFFSGTRPPSELAVFLSLADVLCSPRVKGENTPFKLYSYLASGKPIVATRIPTHTQLLDDSLAFLVEPSAQGVASGLRQALEQEGEARARAERGLGLVDREYSAERYREKVAHAYAEIARSLGDRS
jgi:glycosyltransferase involved in cell wall biosynthesis